MEFGKELQRRRNKLGLSIRELEIMVGFSDTAITNLEHGKGLRTIPLHKIQALSNALNWPADKMAQMIEKEICRAKIPVA